jgi:hypothetical protein
MKGSPLRAIITDLIDEGLLDPENVNKALQGLLMETISVIGEAISALLDIFDIQRNQGITLEGLANGVALGNELI